NPTPFTSSHQHPVLRGVLSRRAARVLNRSAAEVLKKKELKHHAQCLVACHTIPCSWVRKGRRRTPGHAFA
ncbi:MAG: hypothetical protein KDA64_15460, partial [Rhodospirillaceae bacterium]|nr:hypothetical protein [Rhodospirillaceae bacterium]